MPEDERLERFDGQAAWAALSPEQQAEIGALALEYIIAEAAMGTAAQDCDAWGNPTPLARACIMAELSVGKMLADTAVLAIAPIVPFLLDASLPVPIPSLLGPVCRACGCSTDDPCEGGCGWAEEDLCTACAEPAP